MEQTDFIHLGLSQALLRAVTEKGYTAPTEVQAQSIPAILDGRDIIAQSQTGTGKTAAFALPLIQNINPGLKKTQVLILCPTRELALQVCGEINDFAKHLPKIRCVAVYGGEPIGNQLRKLRGGASVIVGTPGRLIDHLKRKTISADTVRTVVLDEADEMLDMGFLDDIRYIMEQVPERRQTLLFSATLSDSISEIAQQYQTDPVRVNISKKRITVSAIEQYYYEIAAQDKTELLCRLYEFHRPRLALIFCNTKKQVDELTDALQLRGYPVKGLHGDMNQQARNQVISSFHRGRFRLLAATDVAARGLDISGVEAVFNFDIPQDIEYYVHRIGRTGRAGKTGMAFTFVTSRREYGQLNQIRQYANAQIQPGTIPTARSFQSSRIETLIRETQKILQDDSVEEYEPIMDKIMEAQDCTSVQIACALIQSILTDGQNGSPKEIQTRSFSRRGTASGKRTADAKSNGTHTRLFLSIGSAQKIGSDDIIRTITKLGKLKTKDVKNVKVLSRYSFIDVPAQSVNHLLRAAKGQKISGNRFSLRRAAVK